MISMLAVEDNILAYYQGIARYLGGQFTADAQVVWFSTGRRSLTRLNGVLRLVAGRPAELRRVAAPILDAFLAQNLPFLWAAWPPNGAPGLADFLNATGLPLVHAVMPGMARHLDDLPPVAPPAGVEIVRVQTEQDQADWLDVHMAGFEEPAALYAPLVAGIYHVTTLPADRGRGLGKALTLAAMHAARAAGYADAFLAATPSGFPLYQRLGFETVVSAEIDVWNGER